MSTCSTGGMPFPGDTDKQQAQLGITDGMNPVKSVSRVPRLRTRTANSLIRSSGFFYLAVAGLNLEFYPSQTVRKFPPC